MSEVTRVLSAMEEGDPHAAEQLLPLGYDELRRLAAQKLAQEKPEGAFVMKQSKPILMACAVLLSSLMLCVSVGWAADWPMFGRDHTRNAVSPEKGPPLDWRVTTTLRRIGPDGLVQNDVDDENIKWSAQLGSQTVASPVVNQGLVWIGTNNGSPRDTASQADAGVLRCFRASDGQLLYRYVAPRLRGAKLEMENDSPYSALACTPLVEQDRLWFTTNRCEIVCLDIGPLQRDGGGPHVVWKVDMRKELGVYPQTPPMAIGPATSISASYQGLLYVVTTNGVSARSGSVPAPEAPSLVCFQKDTGKIIWQDHSPGNSILEGQWASPLVVEIGGHGQVIAPQGDGWVRSFDALTGKLLWKCDTNPKGAKWLRFGGRTTRNSILATPVYYDGRVYIGNGLNSANYGPGVGWLYCLDPTKKGDISLELEDRPGKAKTNPNSGVVWHYGGPIPENQRRQHGRDWYFGRTQSSCVIQDGLVYAVDLDGYFHCLDARTGKHYWQHELNATVFGSPCWVDGKVYVGTHDGDVWIFAHGREKKEPHSVPMGEPIYGAPIFGNGMLYIATATKLYAIQAKQESESGQPIPHGYWPQWRGPDRSNISQEKGLLQQWPTDGPPLLWKAIGLGSIPQMGCTLDD
jgi:outer membrane protein assembly factor BamB